VQKQIILDTLKSFSTHPSADELHSEIIKSHPSISKATVYRNMRHLAEKGAIIQIAVANDVARYDGCVDCHQHFICEKCGGIFDVHIGGDDDSEKLNDAVRNKYGYQVDKCITSFTGTCLDCI